MTRFKEKLDVLFHRIPVRVWAVSVCLVSLGLSLAGLAAAINVVVVADSQGHQQFLLSPTEDPTELMNLAGITAQEGDDVYCTVYTGNRVSVMIQRAFDVTVAADGENNTVQLTEGTVQDAVTAAGIELGEHDYTEPTLSTALSPDDTITVHRVQYQDVVAQQTIEPQVIYKETSLLCRNRSKSYVAQEGSAGVLETTTRQRVVDGVVESGEVVSQEVTVPAQDTIIMTYGAGAAISQLEAPAGITVTDGVPSSYSAVYTGRATAYSASQGSGASGLGLYEGTVAVDPDIIPYGSLLYIVSTDGQFVYGFAVATDTGTALQDGKAIVDLFYDTHTEAYISAVRNVNVYVVG